MNQSSNVMPPLINYLEKDIGMERYSFILVQSSNQLLTQLVNILVRLFT